MRTLITWSANILGGFLLLLFLVIFVGESISSMHNNDWQPLKQKELILMVCVIITLIGLFLAYFKRLIGSIFAIIGSTSFITVESLSDGEIFSLSDGLYFYLLLLAGLLHLIASTFKTVSPVEINQDMTVDRCE